ncbi:bifunctional phosphopantothenoylcysteine decarboxylase/phosphopantothenate--cysteine ligase CoaBC [Halothermothrix orenii]|uniref:Coenzyme A biosynthesis bifunctional protein CoaBC n=1 Tax=Halothermothrix orenii (strain H 168 / OCM 544 / DSM 9562) TaxID=373903 RepID=B8CWS0_HALOH|nr:bifunctional phosphopantothenoylcysteine decarboxylase/phosphopantothenate--cysteine ligase CoaBC [Halothermothrix orenii]ACL69739.1 phosphopantothenoylcysteine decarboxylase/phosphopantothenate--cysteine ligase [Halothermothrix orenii H 168]
MDEEKKHVLLGVTGGIAAYKAVDVASRLTKAGVSTHVVMTESAKKFVTPLTFRSITHNPVEDDLFTPPAHYNVKHTSLASLVDVCLVAPATANFIGKIASGIADDLLTTVIMATNSPVLISPSMNVNMYNNPIVQDNISYLKDKGYKIIEPSSGYLACGDTGKGRLPEPYQLVEHVLKYLSDKDLQDRNILITAGPTREPLDPVRFLSNYSSGKMGYALARAASFRGARVTLISGPGNLKPPVGVNFIRVKTARDMFGEVKSLADDQDIFILAAAVSDYRPSHFSRHKIKKKDTDMKLVLERNPDIAAYLGKNKTSKQLLIGFAAESDSIIENAREKMIKKNLDMIIANDITGENTGFESDYNKGYLIRRGNVEKLPEMDKYKLANLILDQINK